jgi:hypothetical protein
MSDEKWAYVSKSLGNVTDKARKLAREICEAAWANGHDVYFLWGDGSEMDHMLNHTQQHPVIDFMVHNEAAGDFVRDYIWNNRARLGLRHVIWEQHITSTVVQPGVRRQMEDRGDPTANHFDHVHSEWFSGTYVPLNPTPQPDSGTDVLKIGTKGPEVLKLQTFFKNNFPGYARYSPVRRGQMIDVDGDFGPQTAEWVKEFQRRTEIGVDGEVGPVTMGKLKANGYK